MFHTEGMIIKPLDILIMLDDEDVILLPHQDLQNLCILVSLDLQIEKETYANSTSNRRNLC